jgi:hypothetical protein
MFNALYTKLVLACPETGADRMVRRSVAALPPQRGIHATPVSQQA